MSPWIAACAALLALAACGGASRPALHETFAAIQVEEARIEHAAAAHAASDACADRAGACAELCDASSALCELARASEDRDAMLRCERADVRCASCRADAPCEATP